MKKILSLLLILASVAMAQSPQPLYNRWIPGITRTTVYDNRSASTSQLTYVSLGCSGTGTWSGNISYGSTSNGSFTNYPGNPTVTNLSASPVAQGLLLSYPNFIKVTITGTATCTLSGFQRFYTQTAVPGTGTVTDVDIQGTSNQIAASGTCKITSTGTCTLSLSPTLTLPGTINKLTLTAPATGATLTLADGKTVTVNNSITINGTDGTTITMPNSSATLASLGLTNTFTGRQDATTAASTAPFKTGTSLPATCTVGDQYFKSDETAGQNLYGCTATNTWTLQAGGGGGSSAFNAITSGTNTTAAMVLGTGGSLSTTGSGTIAATTAAALAANPTDCSSGQYANAIAASGNLTCAQIAYSQLSGTPTIYYQAVADEGVSLTARPTINFTGSGVTCTDNSGQSRTDCSISGSGSSTSFTDITGGTNISATMIVGNGAALSASGTGTIVATSATRLVANGTNCSSGQFAQGVDTLGNAEGCTALPTTLTGTANQISVSASTGAITLSIPTSPTLPGTTTGTFSGNLTGAVTGNASTATALSANPADCSAGQYATTIAANGDLTCAQVAYSQLSGTPTIYYQTVADEGIALTSRPTINFIGSGVTCADNSGQSRTDCTISGGGGVSSAFNDITSGTNASAAMVVGTGASLSVSGSGTIAATTSVALATNGTNCSSGQFAAGVDANGNSEGCAALPTTITGTANQISVSASTGAITLSLPSTLIIPGSISATTFTGALSGNATTATALAANPADCASSQFANAIAANGDLTCSALTLAGAQFANQGTTTTLLHGNASGNPSWSQVVNADISASAAIALSKLATQAADTLVMNASGGAAVPTAVAMPTSGTNGCSGTSNALTYNSSSHALDCNTSVGTAASAVTTTCSGASATFTATSNTINRFDCTLIATNVTSSTLASLTSGGLYTIVITQPVGGGITFAAPTGLTGFLPITSGNGDAASEVCTVEFVATSTTAGRVTAQNCTGGTPGITFSNSTSGTTSIQGPATGTNVSTAPSGTQALLGHNATNTFGTAGTLDMSAAINDEAFRLPNVAGATNTTEGACSYDTTNDNVHCGENGVDTILPSVLVSAPLVNGNCVQASVTSSRVRLSDAGAACGGGSSSYFPQYSCIDDSTGWSDYNYGTQMTITALPNTAGSNCGIWAQQEGSDYVRARVKSTGSSTFNAKYALRIGTMIGDGAEAGVLVKDSGTQSVVCGLRFSAGSQRFLWQGDRYTTTSATSAAETINSAWTAGSAQYALAYNTGAGNPGAYFTGQALLYIELASTNGTTTTCRASFDGVIWIPVWSSTFLTPDSTGYYTRSGFSTTDNLYVLGTN